jgi:hypothetical protein
MNHQEGGSPPTSFKRGGRRAALFDTQTCHEIYLSGDVLRNKKNKVLYFGYNVAYVTEIYP